MILALLAGVYMALIDPTSLIGQRMEILLDTLALSVWFVLAVYLIVG